MFVCVCVYVCMYVCTMQVMAQSLRVLHYLCTAVPDPAVAAAVAAGAVGKCVEFSRKNDAESQPLSRELRVASVDVLCLLGRYEAALAHMAEPMSRVVESLADGETEVQLAAVQGLQALLSTDAIDGEVGAGGGSGPGIGPFAMQKPGEGNAELAGDAGRAGNAAREGGAGSVPPDGRDKVGGELGGGGGGGAGLRQFAKGRRRQRRCGNRLTNRCSRGRRRRCWSGDRCGSCSWACLWTLTLRRPLQSSTQRWRMSVLGGCGRCISGLRAGTMSSCMAGPYMGASGVVWADWRC